MREEITVYAVQSGLGKTWVCQHYPGWFDLDWHPYEAIDKDIGYAIYREVFLQQVFYKYKIAMTLKFQLIEELLKHPARKYKVVFVFADPGRKEEIISNISKRAQGNKPDAWARTYAAEWDRYQSHCTQFIQRWKYRNIEYVYLKKGEFFEDFLKKRGAI